MTTPVSSSIQRPTKRCRGQGPGHYLRKYLLTHWINHSLTYSLTHSFTYLLTHWLIHLLNDSVTYSVTYSLTDSLIHYLLTSRSTVLLEKLTVPQLVKKFPTFYGTRRFITAVKSARHLSLSSARLIQSIPQHPHFLKTHLNIMLPSTAGSSKRFLTLRISHQNPVYTSPLPIRVTRPAYLILLDLITRTNLASSTDY